MVNGQCCRHGLFRTEIGVLMIGGRKSLVPVACLAVVVAGVVSGCSGQPEISHSAAMKVCGQTLTYNMAVFDLRNQAKPQVFKNDRVTDEITFQVAGCSAGASIEFQPAGSAEIVRTAHAEDGATAGMTIRLLKPGQVSVVRLSPDPATLAVIDVQKRK
jgi:hypothetical protein